jgi:uncharacterized protein (TIGR00159 family)
MNSFLAFVFSIRWQDIIDVLLNSYILFRLYVLFRGTNVIRVLAGIALLWIFQRMAVALGLIVTSWAMQGIIAGATLLIIIVFRNEIRSVLQAKKLRALLWEFPQKSELTPIDAIVQGVYELARQRIGALMVFPGKEDLDEVIRGGLDWGGQVSKEMLVSVFWNGNPAHDGAALIQGNRVTRVGGILPLSLRDDLPTYYGTRHRAAAGLAEQTDALVIVVSEERGAVAAVKGNVFTPVRDNVALEKILAEHLGMAREQGDHLAQQRERKELTIAAAICVFCMAGVWFSFAKGMETLTSIEVPLEYLNRDAQTQIHSTSVNTVRLHLSGSAALIGSLRLDQVKVKLDLSSAVSGQNSYTLSSENIVLPPGLRLNRIEPSEVKVSLDVPATKEVAVQVDWVGALPPGLILENAAVTPGKVKVMGARRVLDRLETVYTEKVPLDNLKSSGQLNVGLVLQPRALKIAEGSRDKVEVSYAVGRRPE